MITLVSVPGAGGAYLFDDDPGPPLTDPWLAMRGQCLGVPNGLNWRWFHVSYPAVAFPNMGASVKQGVENTVYVLLNVHPTGKIVLDGYSEGAIVVGHVWRDEILNPKGRLHHRLNDVLAIIVYGDPLRAPGIAYGNTVLCNIPVPGPLDGFTTGGIAGPDVLTPEQCLFPNGHPLEGQIAVYSHAAVGDLYTQCPIGDNPWTAEAPPGHYETLVYDIVQSFDTPNVLAISMAVLQVLGDPAGDIASIASIGGLLGLIGLSPTTSKVVAIVQAVLNGGMFLFQGFQPHGNYDTGPAIAFLDDLGRQYALAA